MTSDESAEVLAASLLETATAYLPATVLFAAAELRLIDALDEPRTTSELARATCADADGLERLCRVLVAMGILVRAGDRFAATPAARAALAADGRASIVRILRHHHRQVAPLLFRLDDAVRTGRPQHAAWPFASRPPADEPYEELSRHADEYASFLAAMDHASRGVGHAIARAVDLADVRRLVDLGCGGGAVARELLDALPDLTIESFDVPAACELARAASRAAGLAARHSVREGDLRRGIDVEGADAVLLSAVLADWPREERAVILRQAFRVLRPGGLLLVSETLLDDDRSGPLGPAMLSLVMLAAMRGDQLSGREVQEELEAAGFSEPIVRRGRPRDLVTARRPGA